MGKENRTEIHKEYSKGIIPTNVMFVIFSKH